MYCLLSSSPPTLQTSSTALSRVIFRNDLMTRLSLGVLRGGGRLSTGTWSTALWSGVGRTTCSWTWLRRGRWWWTSGGTSPCPLLSASVGQTWTWWIHTSIWSSLWTIELDWYANTEATYKKGLSRLYSLRRLRSFNVCNRMLQMFYQSVVASTIFFAVVSWGVGIRTKDANRLNKLIKKAESVVGSQLVTVEEVVEERMLAKLLATMANSSHPLHTTLDQLRSSFSNRLIQPRCEKELQ